MASLDELIGIRFGHLAPGAEKVEWIFLPHAEFDRIGGFAHLLRERGGDVEDLPKIPDPAALSWLSFLRALPGLLAPRQRLLWKSLKQGAKPDKVNQPPPAVAVYVFSEEDTAKIRWAARNADVSVNSLLLRHLDRAVRPYSQDPSNAPLGWCRRTSGNLWLNRPASKTIPATLPSASWLRMGRRPSTGGFTTSCKRVGTAPTRSPTARAGFARMR